MKKPMQFVYVLILLVLVGFPAQRSWARGGANDHSLPSLPAFEVKRFHSPSLLSFGWRVQNDTGVLLVTADKEKEMVLLSKKLVVYPKPVSGQLQLTGVDGYDRFSVYNMQGAQLINRVINNSTTRVDVFTLSEGVYLLVLHSSATMQDRTVKFIVRR